MLKTGKGIGLVAKKILSTRDSLHTSKGNGVKDYNQAWSNLSHYKWKQFWWMGGEMKIFYASERKREMGGVEMIRLQLAREQLHCRKKLNWRCYLDSSHQCKNITFVLWRKESEGERETEVVGLTCLKQITGPPTHCHPYFKQSPKFFHWIFIEKKMKTTINQHLAHYKLIRPSILSSNS